MYKEIKSRRLALLVAIALTGGSLAGATNAYAAEVTGQNVTINASNQPSNNATDPNGTPGSAAGVINDPANGDNVSGNTLTLENYNYSGKNIFGGFTRGTGCAKDNTVHIHENGKVATAYGGITYGDGDAVGNWVYLHAGGLAESGLIGGVVYRGSGSAEDNHVVVESGRVNDVIFGGDIVSRSTGHVKGNTVEIAGGVINTSVYGGYNNGSGDVTGNAVTITGGEIRDDVYGGFGNGDVKDNIVNIGDGVHDLAAGTRIDKSIYGGSNGGGSGTISGNILKVKASASAQNIHNFDKINFYFTDTLSPKLTLSDTVTTINSLSNITVSGLPTAVTGTLIENTAGTITVSDSSSSVSTTDDTAETILSTDRTGKKIDYARYIFKGARTAESGIYHTWGGRSVIGNTTTGNEITVSSGAHTDVCGGWTRDDASSQTATADKGNSTYNKVTVDGTETVSEDVYGGMTTVADGKASHNEVTINKGVTLNGHGDVYGGSANSGSSADNNKVYLNGIHTPGTVYGGSVGLGTANGNEVHLNGATVRGAVFGGNGGSTNKNKVYLLNDAQVTGDVYGGNATSANDNEVHLNGARVTSAVFGGAANGTGNLLSVKGVNRAGKIAGFQKIHFDTAGVAAGETMLTITDTANRTALNWEQLTATGTARGIDLIYHAQGIDLSNYTAGSVKSALSEDGKSEYDIEAVREGGTVKRIAYNSYQFKDARTAETVGGETWGGRSRVGNTTTGNEITVSSGTHTEVYGGWTSGSGSTAAAEKRGDSISNNVTVNGAATVSGTVYGGYTDVTGGKATGNTVAVEKNLNADLIGGKALGEASGNTVTVGNVTVNSITGGDGTTTKDNTVNLEGGTTVTGTLTGGTAANDTGNTLNVKGKDNKAGTIANIQKMNFDATGLAKNDTMLEVTGTAQTAVNWADLSATGTAAKPLTLLKNANGINLSNYSGAVKSEITGGNTETNIDVVKDSSNKITEITYEGYQFKGVTMATSDGGNLYGGISKAGNSTRENTITVNSGSHTNVYGGHTSGSGTGEADKNNSYNNTVTITGGTVTGKLYGGHTDVAGGKAMGNTVTIEKNLTADIIGGKALGEASGNTVNLANATVKSITGGSGTVTNDNRINLRDAKVTGTVTGGTAANATGNTLAVYYGTGTSSIGDFGGIQNLHFDLENAPTDGTAHTMLNLTNVSGGNKTLSDMNIGFYRSGAAKKLKKGDTFTLVENTTAGGSVSIGDNVKAEGKDGSSRKYEFGITTNAAGELIATVTKAGMGEQSKSIVETRAGASAFLNDGADFTAGPGMDAAKKEARAAAQSGNAPYGIWAGMGGGSLRHETGSYVDMKGWNLGVGWARENAVQAGTLTFGPFIEYGRGSYDSYLDDGTHGSGKTSFLGAGMMAKIETDSHWVDGSLRVGRTKSDYTGLANYDTTSTYYGMQVGAGKDFHVSENDTVGVYVRYAYAHTAGTSAHLSSGETFDFDAVNSHRLRLGTRYTHGMTALSQFYAGLAWEYEFDGDARATSQGDSAPSPSLKGGSALLELGYRFAPQGSRMSYDLSLSGWQGKRQGVTGGVSVKWAF